MPQAIDDFTIVLPELTEMAAGPQWSPKTGQ